MIVLKKQGFEAQVQVPSLICLMILGKTFFFLLYKPQFSLMQSDIVTFIHSFYDKQEKWYIWNIQQSLAHSRHSNKCKVNTGFLTIQFSSSWIQLLNQFKWLGEEQFPSHSPILFIYLFLASPGGLWGLSSPTKDRTWAPCSGSTES